MYEALSPNRDPEKQPKEHLVYKSTLTLPMGVGSPPLFCVNYLFAGLFSLGFGPQWQGPSVCLCILSDSHKPNMSISQPCTYWLVIERVDKQTLTKISMWLELQTYLLIYKTNLKVENIIKIKAARAKVLYSSVFFILKITVQTLKCRHRSKS